MERRGGGIEPLHVSMPLELKSSPSTSPTHPGKDNQRMSQKAKEFYYWAIMSAGKAHMIASHVSKMPC